MSNIDKKLQEMGKRVFEELFTSSPCADWDYFSSHVYGHKLVQYPSSGAYSFYFLPTLDDASYEAKYKELYGEKSEADVWTEIKACLISDIQILTSTKDAITSIINQF